MLDHIGIAVSDYARSKAFYTQALAPLGIALTMEIGPELTGDGTFVAGFGCEDKAFFWFGDPADGDRTQIGHAHIAFVVSDRASVDRFHRTALAAGGRDNGAPGLRPHYHANYYGAFVLDPDGHNIEAVCHAPE